MTPAQDKKLDRVEKIALDALKKSTSTEKEVAILKTIIKDRDGSYDLLNEKMANILKDFNDMRVEFAGTISGLSADVKNATASINSIDSSTEHKGRDDYKFAKQALFSLLMFILGIAATKLM